MHYWIGIASKNHVDIGVQGGFCQLGHGKHRPVKRLNPMDWLIYYAPKTILGGGDKVQSFVAIGQIQSGDPYQIQVSDEFSAWRRNVDYQNCEIAAIHPLLPALSFVDDMQYWGIKFRRPVFEISSSDFEIIATAMKFSRPPS